MPLLVVRRLAEGKGWLANAVRPRRGRRGGEGSRAWFAVGADDRSVFETVAGGGVDEHTTLEWRLSPSVGGIRSFASG
jgi:hypothetical protein